MIQYLKSLWLSYRRRFTPWILFNFKHRESRLVTGPPNLSITPKHLKFELLELCKLLDNELTNVCKHGSLPQSHLNASFKCRTQLYHKVAADAVLRDFGFTIGRQESTIAGAGRGVFITNGRVSTGSLISLYPGLVYEVGEPVFLQSIYNKFMFRCSDGILVDGNDRHLSRFMYRSCAGRDIVGNHLTCDLSWLSQHPVNPLSIGQFVNNHCNDLPGYEANVAYEEFDLPCNFPGKLLKYIPNNFYRSSSDADFSNTRKRRVVGLIALRDIKAGEELFSNYMTLITTSTSHST